MGIIVPNMGKKASASNADHRRGVSDQAEAYAVPPAASALADALFTQTQQRVFGLVFGRPDQNFTVSEMIAAVGGGSGAVQRELRRLADTHLVTVQPVGNQKRYQANPDAPIFSELVGIVQKTVGLAQPLRDALSPLFADIAAAFVYGSVAKRGDKASSDIDVMLISDTLAYAEAFAALEPAAQQLGRAINPTIYTHAQLAKRIKADNAFVTRVLEQPRIWLIGGQDDLAA
jgi:predicted nucleotidyltransferase